MELVTVVLPLGTLGDFLHQLADLVNLVPQDCHLLVELADFAMRPLPVLP